MSPGFVLSRSFFGHTLYLDVSRTTTHWLLYLRGERWLGERYLLKKTARPGDVVVDVGANIGYYALMLARLVGPSGRIICVEPDPENLTELRRNIAANNLTNVQLFDVAAGASEGTAHVVGGINARLSDHDSGDYPVGVMPLDTLIKGPVDFIKIDVEGYEGHVLRGAEHVIATHRPVIFAEIHPVLLANDDSVSAIMDLLRSHYEAVTCFEYVGASGVLAKVRERYGLSAPLSAVDDVAGLLARCITREQRERSWVLCERA